MASNVLGLRDTLRVLAAPLPVPDQTKELIKKAINRLTAENLIVLRPTLAEWARGHARENT